jgi:kynurenine formamidase
VTIHDLTILLNERTLPFLPGGDKPLAWTHDADHETGPAQVSTARIGSHLGTHVDAPLHFIRGGRTTASMPLSSYVGTAACLSAEGLVAGGAIRLEAILERDGRLLHEGDFLIVRTGYETLVGTEAYFDFPVFPENAGALLEARGIPALGMDTPSIGGIPEHRDVLGRGIAIFESLVNLAPLVGKRFFFSAAPLKFEDGDGSPVRAYAVTE